MTDDRQQLAEDAARASIIDEDSLAIAISRGMSTCEPLGPQYDHYKPDMVRAAVAEIRNILAEGGGEVEDPMAGLCDHDAYHRLHPTPDVTEAPAGDE